MTYPVDRLRNAQADEDAARIAAWSLHTADPGLTGANEATGGGYVRVAPSFTAAGVEGALGAADQPATDGYAWDAPSFSLAAGEYPYVGAWDASGNWLGGEALSTQVVLAADGTAQVSLFAASEA